MPSKTAVIAQRDRGGGGAGGGGVVAVRAGLHAYVLAEHSGFPPKATEGKGSGIEGDFTIEKPTNSTVDR